MKLQVASVWVSLAPPFAAWELDQQVLEREQGWVGEVVFLGAAAGLRSLQQRTWALA